MIFPREADYASRVPLPTRSFADLPLSVCTPAAAARWLCEVAAQGRAEPVDVHLVNAYTIARAESDAEFRRALASASVNLPDGKPLAWLTRFGGQPLTQVRGPGLFNDVIDLGRKYGLRHFLLGTTDETLHLLRAELEARYPGVEIAGVYSPPFRTLSEAERLVQDDLVRRSGAHVVWVGLGTPKQDFEAQRLSANLPGMAIAVGAAFDFVAGTKREAPAWMTRVGLEWSYRLITEPRRLWRRYLVGNIVFLRAVLLRGIAS